MGTQDEYSIRHTKKQGEEMNVTVGEQFYIEGGEHCAFTNYHYRDFIGMIVTIVGVGSEDVYWDVSGVDPLDHQQTTITGEILLYYDSVFKQYFGNFSRDVGLVPIKKEVAWTL